MKQSTTPTTPPTTPSKTSLFTLVIALIKRYRNIILYTIIGGGAVVLDVGFFWILTSLAGLGILLSNTISVFSAMVYSFALNATFTFKVRDKLFRRFLSFASVTAFGYITSTLMLVILSDMMGFNSVLVKIASLPVVLFVQFSLNSAITFKSHAEVAK